MEGGELRVASGRIGSSSIWRNGAVDVFSGSSRREDDEQELQWAAIEKLPTYLRVTRGVLAESQGQQPIEIDVNKLGPLQRKNLVERLVRIAEEDNERFLLKLRQRIDRVATGLVLVGSVRFHSEAKISVDIIIETANEASETIHNTTEALKGMENSLMEANVNIEASSNLDSTAEKLDDASENIEMQARKNRRLINKGLKIV